MKAEPLRKEESFNLALRKGLPLLSYLGEITDFWIRERFVSGSVLQVPLSEGWRWGSSLSVAQISVKLIL